MEQNQKEQPRKLKVKHDSGSRLKNLWIVVKCAWKAVFRSNIDEIVDEQSDFVRENAPKAVAHLESLGWRILSTDRRIFFYSFKVQKGDFIHEVSVREALKML